MDNLSDQSLKLIQREICLNKLIQHANILKYNDCFIINSYLWCSTPYITYGTITDIINNFYNNGIPELIAIKIIYDIIKALIYIHSRNLIHRNICSDNVYVSNRGIAYLSGLRCACSMYVKGKHVDKLFDFPYYAKNIHLSASPEMLSQDLRGYNKKTDIYSLGLVACHIVSGIIPYSNIEKTQVFLEKINGNLPSYMSFFPHRQSLIMGTIHSVKNKFTGLLFNQNKMGDSDDPDDEDQSVLKSENDVKNNDESLRNLENRNKNRIDSSNEDSSYIIRRKVIPFTDEILKRARFPKFADFSYDTAEDSLDNSFEESPHADANRASTSHVPFFSHRKNSASHIAIIESLPKNIDQNFESSDTKLNKENILISDKAGNEKILENAIVSTDPGPSFPDVQKKQRKNRFKFFHVTKISNGNEFSASITNNDNNKLPNLNHLKIDKSSDEMKISENSATKRPKKSVFFKLPFNQNHYTCDDNDHQLKNVLNRKIKKAPPAQRHSLHYIPSIFLLRRQTAFEFVKKRRFSSKLPGADFNSQNVQKLILPQYAVKLGEYVKAEPNKRIFTKRASTGRKSLTYLEMSYDMKNFIFSCLNYEPEDRQTAENLITYPLFKKVYKFRSEFLSSSVSSLVGDMTLDDNKQLNKLEKQTVDHIWSF
ncbi:uncharacterized protein LOC135929568 isoform X1 [Gordionus sp. m RMFG-2023]|uniref:uncharacterized protein LOC135929568 isoform X1 n=1 Tax=Gordionus sp. m RMFG-2023 TaxID=3053472 RepID=UPI0031FBCBB7